MNTVDTINIQTLLFFIEVFDAQSFSVVARKEGVSASKVSRIIKQLEDSLGQQLFYRNTRAVIPTEAGRVFMRYAKSMTESMSAAQQELQDRTLEPGGLIRINAPVFFGQRHIAPWLPQLSAQYPKLQIDLSLTDDFIDPHHYATDVIFRIGTLHDSAFHARIFGEQTYHLAASPSYINTHGKLQVPADLTHHKCLVYKGSTGPNRWLFKTESEDWTPFLAPALLMSNNAESLLVSALKGMGIVLFPDWLIGEYLKSGELIKLLPDYNAAVKTTPQHVAAIYPHTRHVSLNVRALIDYFAKVYGHPLYWQLN
ncbi:LysR family transcriptional regulator [Psychrobacter sp. ANT_H56B]|uniref:LysR family transcriptional regulator n=1 Tax=Psychrobacter sp. ANT_H56B TaxID=2597353 RepID=UPI0011F1941D|nr:LysR family transcriptional regulator [Psychrobacter sp. ANT_H56B]KAA0929237.1 LysR family transcriptional regulator [Psychrobacter sp. ANT_H56B]